MLAIIEPERIIQSLDEVIISDVENDTETLIQSSQIEIDCLLKINSSIQRANYQSFANTLSQELSKINAEIYEETSLLSHLKNTKISHEISTLRVIHAPTNHFVYNLFEICNNNKENMVINVYKWQDIEGPIDEMDEGENVVLCTTYSLPSEQLDGLWNSLYFEGNLKEKSLNYIKSLMIFSTVKIDRNLISYNNLVLFHGPPGSGKTSLCKALAQRISIIFQSKFKKTIFVEVNCHSLFSKFFSESGKLIQKLFSQLQQIVSNNESVLLILLLDEVESLTSSRETSISKGEPTDSIRAVNSLLTQLDKMKKFQNVLTFSTSNLTTSIDEAFIDRVDFKYYVDNPSIQAKYTLLREAILELISTKIIQEPTTIIPQNLSSSHVSDDSFFNTSNLCHSTQNYSSLLLPGRFIAIEEIMIQCSNSYQLLQISKLLQVNQINPQFD